MRARRSSPGSPAMQAALEELRQIILAKYPDARFEVHRGIDEPGSFELDAIIDTEDDDDVLDLVINRLMAYQLDDGLLVHVIPSSLAEHERIARAAAAAAKR